MRWCTTIDKYEVCSDLTHQAIVHDHIVHLAKNLDVAHLVYGIDYIGGLRLLYSTARWSISYFRSGSKIIIIIFLGSIFIIIMVVINWLIDIAHWSRFDSKSSEVKSNHGRSRLYHHDFVNVIIFTLVWWQHSFDLWTQLWSQLMGLTIIIIILFLLLFLFDDNTALIF